MNTYSETLDSHITAVLKQIAEAAAKQDLDAIQQHSAKLSELKQLRDQVIAIGERIANLNRAAEKRAVGAGSEQSVKARRQLPIEITFGDIRQSLLKLTRHIKRGKIAVGEELIVEALPSGERFQTVVSEKGNKLRARGEIARFYKDAKIVEGDHVLLSEITPGQWQLRKAQPGEFVPRQPLSE